MGEACPRLRVLEMRECDQVELQGSRALARSLPMLEHLDVTGSPYFCRAPRMPDLAFDHPLSRFSPCSSTRQLH
ncbi:hypothetical protein L7F22_007191 [Adiantum nelumboides]|nr:hypothetical protein [Adiantum nelumboides]